MTSNTPKEFWNEDANEALRPHLVRCAPAGGVGALFSKKLRCQCDRCHLNKRILKGLLARLGKTQSEPERIPSMRFGPALLVELASIVKVATPVFGVWMVFSSSMLVLERDNTIGTLPVTVTIRQEYTIRGASFVNAGIQTRGTGQKMQIPQETTTNELVAVPEVIRPRPLPPTNLRIVR